MAPIAEQIRALLEPVDGATLGHAIEPASGRVAAAVLVPLLWDGRALSAVLTRRRNDLRNHAGEISFPGGRLDFRGEELATAALRETEEEIGLPPAAVQIVGALSATPTAVTNYRIHPFVGVISTRPEWAPNPAEVADVLEVPLERLRAGHERRLGAPAPSAAAAHAHVYRVDDDVIWGATARILHELLVRLSPL